MLVLRHYCDLLYSLLDTRLETYVPLKYFSKLDTWNTIEIACLLTSSTSNYAANFKLLFMPINLSQKVKPGTDYDGQVVIGSVCQKRTFVSSDLIMRTKFQVILITLTYSPAGIPFVHRSCETMLPAKNFAELAWD